MGFLSKLKAVGKGVLKVFPVAQQFAPAVVAGIAGIAGPGAGLVTASILQRVSTAVGLAERTAALIKAQQGVDMNGQSKLALALSVANETIPVAEIVAGRNIVDNDKFARGTAKFQEGTAKFQEGIAKLVEAVADIEDSIDAGGEQA